MKTVKDMYKYVKDHNIAMLSTFPGHFWDDYRFRYDQYDALFNRMFNSFFYFMQDDDEDIADITTNFIADCYNHLLVNNKKYEELYRVHVIPDENYSLTDNYDMTETMDKDITDNNENTYGSRTDTSSYTSGEREDSTTDITGTQFNVSTDTVAPYNSEDFYNNSEKSDSLGQREDSSTLNKGEQIDSGSNTKGSQEDTLDRTYAEDYTLHRKGNIGVTTVSDMLKKHKDFWDEWSFYEYIFKEIAKDLLLL